MRWLIVILILAGLVWLAFAVRKWAQRRSEGKGRPDAMTENTKVSPAINEAIRDYGGENKL